MEYDDKVFPAERSKKLEGPIRKLMHSPKRLLGNYVKEGMTVLDVGCGPGFFSVELAKMVGENGKVIAADLQEAMLDKVREKVKGTDLEKRIKLHKTNSGSVGVREKVDFLLAFFIMHELPDQKKAIDEFSSILKNGGTMYVAEPTFKVSEEGFELLVSRLESAGFSVIERPHVLMGRAAVLKK